MNAIKEFFGLIKNESGSYDYTREASGAWSWQHLTFVSLLLLAMIALSIWVGRRNRSLSSEQKNKTLVICAIAINAFELLKIVVLCIRCQDPLHWLYVLPLFLCSIQLIAIPLAAFCRGRVREASLDFVMIFGILGAIFGTVGAAQNYGCYPVLSMDNVFSGLTHCISGFASLYIILSGMTSMKRKNFPITVGIMLGFSALAYIANIVLDYNYMFLMEDDGTPYSIFYNLVGGHPVFYPLIVVGLFVVYILAYYWSYYKILALAAAKKAKQQANAPEHELVG